MTTIVRVVFLVFVVAVVGWRVATRVELSTALDLLAAGDAEHALDRLERVRAWGVDSTVVDFNAATALLKLQRYDAAAARFRQVAEETTLRERRGAALFGAGNAEAKAGRYREAAEAYRESLRTNSDNEDARFNLMWVMRRLPDPKSSPPANDAIDSLDQLTTPLRLSVPRLPNAPRPVDAR